MRVLKYTLVYVIPALVTYALWIASSYSWSTLFVVFGLIPLLEWLLPSSSRNLSEAEEAVARNDRAYDVLLYLLVPVQYLLLFYFIQQINLPGLSWSVRLGMTTAFGISCGVLGINAAHELGHRKSRFEQLLSKALLLSTLYMHFFIEHNRGHHDKVSTDEDPASSRLGEGLYPFLLRSITTGWVSAWQLEKVRLQRAELPFWSLHNEMLRFQLIQVLFAMSVAWFAGFPAFWYYLSAAAIGWLLLETVNYIEHYGLRRVKTNNRYERTMPVHSWNSNHPIGRLLLLELSRHSDHHYQANRKYQLLRHFDESPQMPTGYPGMMLLALIPPLWFRVMNPRVQQLKSRPQGNALA